MNNEGNSTLQFCVNFCRPSSSAAPMWKRRSATKTKALKNFETFDCLRNDASDTNRSAESPNANIMLTPHATCCRQSTITAPALRVQNYYDKTVYDTALVKRHRRIFNILWLVILLVLFNVVTAGMPRLFLLKPRVRDSPGGVSQLLLFHKTKHYSRMRRSKPACTVDDYSKPGVQEAIFKMIVGGKTADVVPMVRQMSKMENSGNFGSCSEIDESQNGGSGMKLGFDISPDMPLEMRAICSFDYEENIDEKRIPRSIREVKCLCKVPQQTEGIRCEPVYNEVPVLVFDDTCTSFREELQPIAFACVTVLTSQSQSTYTISIGSGGKNDNVQI